MTRRPDGVVRRHGRQRGRGPRRVPAHVVTVARPRCGHGAWHRV